MLESWPGRERHAACAVQHPGPGSRDGEVPGNIVHHEYHIGEGRDKVAEVSKKRFRVRDTCGVAIDPGQNDVLILAITVCVDMMGHEGR